MVEGDDVAIRLVEQAECLVQFPERRRVREARGLLRRELAAEAVRERVVPGSAATMVEKDVPGDAEHPGTDLVVVGRQRVRALPEGDQGLGEEIRGEVRRLDTSRDGGLIRRGRRSASIIVAMLAGEHRPGDVIA